MALTFLDPGLALASSSFQLPKNGSCASVFGSNVDTNPEQATTGPNNNLCTGVSVRIKLHHPDGYDYWTGEPRCYTTDCNVIAQDGKDGTSFLWSQHGDSLQPRDAYSWAYWCYNKNGTRLSGC